MAHFDEGEVTKSNFVKSITTDNNNANIFLSHVGHVASHAEEAGILVFVDRVLDQMRCGMPVRMCKECSIQYLCECCTRHHRPCRSWEARPHWWSQYQGPPQCGLTIACGPPSLKRCLLALPTSTDALMHLVSRHFQRDM